MKKILAIVVALCLMTSVMAVSASAADNDIEVGASLNLNEGIAIQFVVNPDAVKSYDSTYITVDYLDRDEKPLTAKIDAEDYTLEGTQLKRYLFTGVSPDRLDNEVTAILYGVKGGNSAKICELEPYSVKTYIANTYEKTTDSDTELRTLLADLLCYGEKARAYTGVSDTPLYSGSDWEWVDTTKSSVIDGEDTSSVKNLTYSDDVTSSTEHISWSSVGLNLRENPAILYKFKFAYKADGVSNYTLVVEDAEGTVIGKHQLSADDYDKTEGCYIYRFRGLGPTKMGEKVTAYFVDGSGNKVSADLDYSVESFANYCYTETDGGKSFTATITKGLYELTQALLEYGEATLCLFDGLNIPMSTVTYTLADETDRFHITGRTGVVDSTKYGSTTINQRGMIFDYAAQGLIFEAECAGDITISLAHYTREQYEHHYTVYIDGERQDRIIAESTPGALKAYDVTVATNLERGVHKVEVYRNHDAVIGISTLFSVTMRGTPHEWVKDEDQLQLQFLGDSVTSGSGVFGTGKQSNIKYSSGTDAYAFIASRILNAEANIVSRSGMTAAADTGEPNMFNYYNNLCYEREKVAGESEKTTYTHSSNDIDLFVVALGSNDTNNTYFVGTDELTAEEKLARDVKVTLAAIRDDYPDTKILWVYGQLTKDHSSVIEQAVEEMGGEDKNFYYYCCKTPDTDGCWYHPDAEAQQRDGEEVAAEIKKILNIQ